ncbi:hypothetical protein TNCV_3356961 [Trichonephila clavipes]|nr:hypothetical protein TNCV_3356961 [Trichonephila clavipes]
MKFCFTHMDPSQLCPGKGLVLTNLTIDEIAVNARHVVISLSTNMLEKSPFAIQKALIGTGGKPNSERW